MRIFLDADVLVAACYSNKGASFEVLKSTKVELYTSSICLKETEIATKRLGCVVDEKLFSSIKKVIIGNAEVDGYLKYVKDPFDAHVVAGAVKAKANILTTFNQKHYLSEDIDRKLGILVYRPGELLFYIRNVLL